MSDTSEYIGYVEEFLPEIDADFNHWSKMPYWSLEESVTLLLGQDPEVVNWDIAQDYQEWPSATDLSLNYAKLRNLILRAFEMKEIDDPNTPADFIVWAESRGIQIPEVLKQQVDVVKSIKASMDAKTLNLLQEKDDKISVLRKRIEELDALIWDGFDENQSTHSKELAIAVKAHGAISKNWKKGMSIKQQITMWLESNYPKLMNEEKERIAKICNWQKTGGAPSTP